MNDQYLAKAHVLLTNLEEVLIPTNDIRILLAQVISEDKLYQIEEYLSCLALFFPHIDIPDFISVKFDEFSQIIYMQVAPTLLKMSRISCDKYAPIQQNTEIPVANWSGYVNMRYSSGVGYYYVPDYESDVEPHNILSNFNIQHADWCFTGAFNLLNSRNGNRFFRDLLWVHDSPKKHLRLFLGEFTPPIRGTIQNTNVLGIGITKNSSFFGEENSLPIRSYEFFLQRPSKIEMYVNEVLYDVYNLPAGPHTFNNLPVLPGNNRIALRVRDMTGEQGMQLDYFYDPSLLQPGKSEWGTSLGFAQNFQENTYQWKEPTLSGYYGYGMNPTWTSGVYFQGSPKECQLGSENIWLTSTLKTGLDFSAICLFGGKIQPRCRLTIQNIPHDESPTVWFANLEYLGKRYSLRRSFYSYQDYLNFRNFVIFSSNLNLTRRLSPKTLGNVGISYDIIKSNKSKFGINASISSTLTNTLSWNLNAYSSAVNSFWNQESGVIFSINWNPLNSNFRGNCSYDSYSKNRLATLSYDKNLGGYSSISANVGVNQHHKHNSLMGSINYQGELFEVQGSNYAAYQRIDKGKDIKGRSGWMAATSFVFADGVYGISRPIYDSFIMIQPEASLKQYKLGVNPIGNNSYTAKTHGPLPAILPNVLSFRPAFVSIEMQDLPLGYEVEEHDYFCFPKYKSGTLITVKESGILFAEGTLIDSENRPIPLILGRVKLRSAQENLELSFFTNRKGEFQIIGLKNGIFDLTLADGSNRYTVLEIPFGTTPGIYEIGTIKLEK